MTNTLKTGTGYLWMNPRGIETELVWVAGLWSLPNASTMDREALLSAGWVPAYQDTLPEPVQQ